MSEIEKYRNYKGNISHCKATRCPIVLNLLDETDNLKQQLQAYKDKEDVYKKMWEELKTYFSKRNARYDTEESLKLENFMLIFINELEQKNNIKESD